MSALPRRALKVRSAKCNARSISTTEKFIIIGGGVAGVCCAQEVVRLKGASQDIEVIIITATELLKEVTASSQPFHSMPLWCIDCTT